MWFLAGGGVGGVAGFLMRGEDDSGVFGNVLVGVVLALTTAWFAATALGMPVAASRLVNFGSLAAALAGAITVLALVGWARRRGR